MTHPPRTTRISKAIAGVSLIVAAIVSLTGVSSAQTVVGPNDIAYRERAASANRFDFGESFWADSIFNPDRAWYSIGPSWLMNSLPGSRLSFWHEPARYAIDRAGDRQEISNDNGYVGTLPNVFDVRLFNNIFGFSGAVFKAPPQRLVSSPIEDDVLVWNNTGTDFNSAGSWTNTTHPLDPARAPNLNDVATFTTAMVTNPVVSNLTTQTVLGIHFDTAGIGYTISGATPTAFLGVGSNGISASNVTGTNSITAGLLLNFDQSITQSAGGTLNITGPVRLGGGIGTTVITIGSNSGNGTINFSPSSAEIGNTIELVTNVNVTLPSIVSETAGAGLIKSGNATLTLTAGAAPSLDGLTTVNAGTLLITNPTGSATGSGAVVVNNGGTLAGNGRIDAGSNTITIHGTLSPGNASADAIHLASSAGPGALTLSSSSIVQFDITDNITKDVIALTTTNVSLGGGTLALNLAGGFDYNGTYAIFTGVSGLTGSFGPLTGYDSANYAPHFALNGTEYDLTFTPIPEPSTWIGAGLALAAMGWAMRRRQRLR